MRFDPIDRRYEDDNGRPLTPKEIRAHIEEWIRAEQKDIDREAQRFIDGQQADADSIGKLLAIADFFGYLANKIRDWHTIAGVIAYGGEDEMTPERWKRIGAKIDSELTYLAGFEESVKNSRIATDLVLAQVEKALNGSNGRRATAG